MHILVLGGAGFIGSHLVEQLVSQNIEMEITVFDNFNSGQVENLKAVIPTIKIFEDDIRNFDGLASSMQGIDWVFHLAAQTSVVESQSNPIFTHEVNNTGTLNVLWSAVQAGVSRVVIASSCSVYGDASPPYQVAVWG